MKIFGIVLSLFFVSAVSARPLTSEERACLFEKPIVVGASITAQTAMSIPLYHTGVSALAAARGIFFLPAFGPSPNRFLFTAYGGQNVLFKGETDYSKMFTQKDEDLGSYQINQLLSGDRQSVFNSASLLIGLDVFYWDAIWNNCEYSTSGGTEKVVSDLILRAREKNVALILATVPEEDPKQVLIDSDTLGIPGLWYAPKVSCVRSINRTLKSLCRPEDKCFLVDLNAMVARLNRGEALTLKNGASYTQYSIRPDGVHLSVNGSVYVYEQMVNVLEAHPPKCN